MIKFFSICLLIILVFFLGILFKNTEYVSLENVGMAQEIRADMTEKLSKGHSMQVIGISGGMMEAVDILGGYLCNVFLSFAGDLITRLLDMFRIDTESVDLLQANWNAHFDRNPNSYFLQFFHSRAGIEVSNALLSYSEEKRRRIVAVGIAPEEYVYEEACLSAIHYRVDNPKRDLVPYINFQSPTYEKAIKDEIADFINLYGK